MMTTIDMPDTLYRKIGKTAKHLGMDYKQFFVFVAENYVKEYNSRINTHSAIGMWADRNDMENPTDWIETKRSSRKNRLFGKN